MGERHLEGLACGIGEQAGRACQAEVSHQESGGRSGAAPQTLQAKADLDQRRSQRQLGLGVGLVAGHGVQVGAIGIRKAVRPQAFQPVELAIESLDAHTGSTKVAASWPKADSARTQDSASRVTT